MLVSQHQLSYQEEQRAKSPGDIQLFRLLLQPHFLFNSLNNLYALSVKRSDQTADAIAGLSELLEKVVKSSRYEFIPLDQELKLIGDYIKLEKIWLGETTFLLDFQVSGNIDQIMVPPLLLYTFVENCFKHGIRKCEGDGWMTIKVEVRNNTLHFRTRNLVPEWSEESSGKSEDNTGFGVVAAREILEKKCNGKFCLNTSRKETVYSVNLVIRGEK